MKSKSKNTVNEKMSTGLLQVIGKYIYLLFRKHIWKEKRYSRKASAGSVLLMLTQRR